VPTVRDIKREICRAFRVTPTEIEGNSRVARIAHPRALFAAAARGITNASYSRIGQAIGGRHHSTVMHLEKRGIELLPRYPDEMRRFREAVRKTL
jgi:chromosomal replication initiator protein